MNSTAIYFRLNDDLVIDNAIVVDKAAVENPIDFIQNTLLLPGNWIEQTDARLQVAGAIYDAEKDIYIPPKPMNVDWLVFNYDLLQWVPNLPFPEDADYVFGYGPQPDVLIGNEATLEDGTTVTAVRLNIADEEKMYRWNEPTLDWILMPKQPATVLELTPEEIKVKFLELQAQPSNPDTI